METNTVTKIKTVAREWKYSAGARDVSKATGNPTKKKLPEQERNSVKNLNKFQRK